MPMHVPPGHHYSPIPSAADLRRVEPTDGPGPREIPGVDLREPQQWDLVRSLLGQYPEVADWLDSDRPRQFKLDNTWFFGSDAVFFALMLRHLQPRRLVEVGSGFSSALALDVSAAYLNNGICFTFIDPNTSRLQDLLGVEPTAATVVAAPVQDVALDVFDQLGHNDVLAIDSSHVMKAGSDVHHLLLHVLPRLQPGVVVHIHDIFHPFEYPRSWLATGTALNEAYALRAVLQSNDRVHVMLWNHFLQRFERQWFAQHMPLCLSAKSVTGGIWLRIGDDPGDPPR